MISIIIVNYKNQDLILNCVRSIVEKEVKLDYEIIVVDNNSQDNSKEALLQISPAIRWVQMSYNSGFGRANNVGIKEAKGDYLLLLNSDVIVKNENTISDCLHCLESLPEKDKIVLGTRLVDENANYQATLSLEFPGLKDEIRANAFYIFIANRLFSKKNQVREMQKESHKVSGFVPWINAAFLLVNRNSILHNNLLFDEDFFLYAEDNELAWRINKKGMKFYHWHENELMHVGSGSSVSEKARFQQIMASKWLCYMKTRGFLYTMLTLKVVAVNQFLDGMLYFFAKARGKSFSEDEKMSRTQRKWTVENLKKYAFKILFTREYSFERSFVVNCYQ